MHRGSGAPIRFEHPVTILCGKGNNAGDGFVIARHLLLRGVNAKVILLASPEQLTGDARRNYEILLQCNVPLIELSSGVTPILLDEYGGDAAWLVDAMLGTGAAGEPREPIATAIRWMNAHPGRRLAVDLPSGLDCDTGVGASATVRADVTCTFVALKPGFLEPEARPYLGEVHVVSIGTPPALLREVI
jgi:NAD(P)H-hydrate epimerase